jgi:hypothetical protein
MKTLSRVSDDGIDVADLLKPDPSVETGGCTRFNPYASQEPSADWRDVFDGPAIGPGGRNEAEGDTSGSLWDRAGDALRTGLGKVGSFFGFGS